MSDFTVDVIDDQLNVTVDVTPESTPIVIEVGTQGPEGIQGDPGPAGTTDHLNLINIGTRSHAQLETDIAAKLTANTAIIGATKTKITYDEKGLVTGGADATTADIADSLNKRYVTDAQQTILGNTSGTNTGDQDLSGLVPYTGATADLNLGAFNLRTNQIKSETANTLVLDTDLRRLYNTSGAETLNFDTKNLVGDWTASANLTSSGSLRTYTGLGILNQSALPSLTYGTVTYDSGLFVLYTPSFDYANLQAELVFCSNVQTSNILDGASNVALNVDSRFLSGGDWTCDQAFYVEGNTNYQNLVPNSVITKKTLTQSVPVFNKSRRYNMNGVVTNLATTGFSSAGSESLRGLTGNNAAGGSVTTYFGGTDINRGRIGNNRSAQTFGSTDFSSAYRVYCSVASVIGRIDFATDSFAFSWGTQFSFHISAAGVTQVRDTNSPGVANYLVGFQILPGGLVSLFVKSSTAATSVSPTLTTLTDLRDIGDFCIEHDGIGNASLYRNEILLGSMSGAPTGVQGPSTVGFALTTTAVSLQREYFIQNVGLVWE